MNRLIHTLCAIGLLCAAPVIAQDRPVVVELFTSQGCSSCPPADKVLRELSGREDVIALALHVDYWDYIGWKDPFGDPVHALRQRAYAAAGGRTSIYTPEMVVNGITDVVGTKPMALSRAIERHKSDAKTVDLRVTREGDDLSVYAEALPGIDGPFTVHLLRYQPADTTQIKRGENAGHTFEYHNIAQSWKVLGSWDARTPFSVMATVSGDLPVVVLVQHSNAGPIAAAARLK